MSTHEQIETLWKAVDRMIVDAWKIGGCEKTLDMLAMRQRFEKSTATLRQQDARVDEAAYRYEAPPWQEIAAAEGDAMAALKVLHNAGSLINAQLPGTAQLCAKWSSLIGAIKAALSAQPAERQGEAGSVDCIGLALDLEQQEKRAVSQTAARAMLAAARGLRLLHAAPVGVPDGAVDTRDHFGPPCVAVVFDTQENANKYRDRLTEALQLRQNIAAAPSAPQGEG